MFRLEADLEAYVAAEAAARWGLESLHLTPSGSRGWPDRLFWIPGGRPLLIEFKLPGEKPRALQVHVHEFLRSIGYDVQVHDDATVALSSLYNAMHHTPKAKQKISDGLHSFHSKRRNHE